MELKTYLNLIVSVTLIAAVAVLVTLVAYNPTSLGPVGVTLWFIGMFVALQGMLTVALYYLRQRYPDATGGMRRFMASWRQGLILSGLAVTMLALSSLRQLSWRDAGLLAVLALLIEFYGRTRK